MHESMNNTPSTYYILLNNCKKWTSENCFLKRFKKTFGPFRFPDRVQQDCWGDLIVLADYRKVSKAVLLWVPTSECRLTLILRRLMNYENGQARLAESTSFRRPLSQPQCSPNLMRNTRPSLIFGSGLVSPPIVALEDVVTFHQLQILFPCEAEEPKGSRC